MITIGNSRPFARWIVITRTYGGRVLDDALFAGVLLRPTLQDRLAQVVHEDEASGLVLAEQATSVLPQLLEVSSASWPMRVELSDLEDVVDVRQELGHRVASRRSAQVVSFSANSGCSSWNHRLSDRASPAGDCRIVASPRLSK